MEASGMGQSVADTSTWAKIADGGGALGANLGVSRVVGGVLLHIGGLSP